MAWATDAPLLAAGFTRSFGDAQLAKRLVYTYMAAAGMDQTWNGDSVTATGTIKAATVRGNIITTDVENTSTEPYVVITDQTIGLYGTATNFIALSVASGAGGTNIDFEGATGECQIVTPDNLADALSIAIAAGNKFLTFKSTNSAEAVLIVNTLASTPPANQTLSTGNTITLPTGCVKVVDTSGAVTGIILAAGTNDGQILHLINASANTVTFDVAATSNVADGASAVIAANRAISLVWDSGSARWYRTG